MGFYRSFSAPVGGKAPAKLTVGLLALKKGIAATSLNTRHIRTIFSTWWLSIVCMVVVLPFSLYGQAKRQPVSSSPLEKHKVPTGRPARATPGYRFQQLYDRPVPDPISTADATVIDTLRFHDGDAPRLYVARVPSAWPALLQWGGYERHLQPLFDTITRQYYRKDFRQYSEIYNEYHVEGFDNQSPKQNMYPPSPYYRPWVISRADLISLNLLVIPAGDTLLNAVVRHTTCESRRALDLIEESRFNEYSLLVDYTDSSYCFRLAQGRLRVISTRPSTYLPTAPRGLNTLEQRLGALARTDPRLANRAKQVLRQPCPWRQQLPLQVSFTPSGLWLLYACYLPPQEEQPEEPETVDIILPYDSLPPSLFRFPSP